MTVEVVLENQFSDLPQLDKTEIIIISDGLCAPHVTDDVLQQIVDEASTPAQDRAAHV